MSAQPNESFRRYGPDPTPSSDQDDAGRRVRALELKSIDADARTMELVFTTGAPVKRGMWEPYWEALSLKEASVDLRRFKSQVAPLLDSHNAWDTSNVIGVVEDAWFEGDGEERIAIARVRFPEAGTRPRADELFKLVEQNIIRSVSVGYRVLELTRRKDREAEDEHGEVVRFMEATSWEPLEVSLCPIGADPGSFVRSGSRKGKGTMAKPDQKSETPDVAPSPPEDGNKPAKTATSVTAEVQRAIETERARAAALGEIAKKLKLTESWVSSHIQAGTSLDEARKSAIDELAISPVLPDQARVSVGEDVRDKFHRGVVDSLLTRANVQLMPGEQRTKVNEFGGLALTDIARMALENVGIETRGLSKDRLIADAFTRVGGSQTTGDFPVILEDLLHKALLPAYALAGLTWEQFCGVDIVSDFRPHSRYRMGGLGSLSPVNEHGEFKQIVQPDGEKETIQVSTYGNILSITRRTLVDDDLGALVASVTRLGRAASLSIETKVYEVLAENSGLGPLLNDGVALFDATHKNIGTGAALSIAAIHSDADVLAEQTDVGDAETYLGLTPHTLVIPLGLRPKALTVNTSEFSDEETQRVPNTARGTFTNVVATPRLTGTRRYIFTDPAVVPVITVSFLNGQREPTIERQDQWRTNGVDYKVYLDFGVDGTDYRGAVTNAGA